jgi:drug/metabolite transporter (DMT)-like permease
MNTRTSLVAILLALLGVMFVAFAVFYATTDTHVLASEFGRHYKHAIVAAALGVLCFVAANFARRRPAA